MKGYFLKVIDFKDKIIGEMTSVSYRIKSLEIAIFCKQLSAILQCGIPLVDALSLISFQSTTRTMREAVSLLIIQIRCGESMYNGLKNSKYRFPEFMLNMIKAGEESGRLDLVLLDLSIYYERENKINKKILGAMFYPATIFIVSMIAIITLMVTVVPSLTSVLSSMGGKIPPITSLVIGISSFMSSNILNIIVSVILLVIILRLSNIWSSDDFKKTILAKLPVLYKIYRRVLQIRFSRTLSLLLRSGMNLIAALELTISVLNNRKEHRAISMSINEIRYGKSLYEALLPIKTFEPLLMSMIKIGEETGKLDEMLTKVVDIYEEETYDMMLRLTEFIQPLLILLLAGMVGIIVISVMLPIMNIIDTV